MTEEKANLSLKLSGGLLVEYLKHQKFQVALLTFTLLTSIGLALVSPQIIRFYLDAVEQGAALDTLLRAAALFLGVALFRQLVNVGVTYVGENVAWTATNSLRADLALHCLKLDMSFHKKYKPGELIERVDGDVNQLANFFSQFVIRLGGNLLLVVGVLILLGLQDWRLGLAIGAVAMVGLLVLHRLNKISVPRWQVVREVEAKLFGFLEEWLNGTEEIRSSGAESYILLRLYQVVRSRYQKVLSAMRVQVLVAALPLGVFALAYSAAHILGATMYWDGVMTIGGVFLIFYYIDLMIGPFWEILRQVEDLQRAAASINRITELRQVQPTISDGEGAIFPSGPLAVAFNDVTFHYEDDQETDVLQDVTFQLAPGTVLGLLGRTGSGKSTMTKLLFRFYDTSSGSIRLGDSTYSGNGKVGMFDIRRAKQADLRQHIGMVTQDVQLFHATVRQNLALFDDSISDQRIIQAIEDVGLGDWLARLPEGLDTHLESTGGGLSAGQAQLLAFARVFLADPGLIVLDEASSRLDPATESLIEKAMGKLLVGRTAIIIAHHLGTVQRADEILILDHGQIAEYGPRAELVGDPDSLFSGLLKTGLEEAMV
jgi:ABC-type multidrug transport system fused ATPase/permease subunit